MNGYKNSFDEIAVTVDSGKQRKNIMGSSRKSRNASHICKQKKQNDTVQDVAREGRGIGIIRVALFVQQRGRGQSIVGPEETGMKMDVSSYYERVKGPHQLVEKGRAVD